LKSFLADGSGLAVLPEGLHAAWNRQRQRRRDDAAWQRVPWLRTSVRHVQCSMVMAGNMTATHQGVGKAAGTHVPAPRLSELLSCFHAMSFCPCSHFCALTAEAITSRVSACTSNTTRPLQEWPGDLNK